MVSSTSDFVLLIVVAVVAYWLGANNNQIFPVTSTITTDDGTQRTDTTTGLSFPITQSFHVAKKLSLVGVGTRKKAIINIYSLGIYVSSKVEKEIEKQSSLLTCETILVSKAPKAVTLTFAMGIGPEKIAEALSAVDADDNIKKEFHDLVLSGMDGGKMTKEESMTLEWKDGDIITVTIRGSYIGEMKDTKLANGVLDLYLGPKSVSPSLRKDLGCI